MSRKHQDTDDLYKYGELISGIRINQQVYKISKQRTKHLLSSVKNEKEEIEGATNLSRRGANVSLVEGMGMFERDGSTKILILAKNRLQKGNNIFTEGEVMHRGRSSKTY